MPAPDHEHAPGHMDPAAVADLHLAVHEDLLRERAALLKEIGDRPPSSYEDQELRWLEHNSFVELVRYYQTNPQQPEEGGK